MKCVTHAETPWVPTGFTQEAFFRPKMLNNTEFAAQNDALLTCPVSGSSPL